MSNDNENKVKSTRGFSIVSGSLLALNISVILQFLQLKQSSYFLNIALILFAISIPLLAASFGMIGMARRPILEQKKFYFTFFIGSLTSIAGLCTVFFYFGNISGYVFLGFTILSAVLLFNS